MRTFVAVEIQNQDVLDAIVKIQSDFKIKTKPIPTQNMHFTLLFLGELTSESVEKVKNSLATILFKSFQVKFTHVGVFPDAKYPRVIWLGVDEEGARKLVEMATQVEKKIEPLGYKPDKPFRPHLTIFRTKGKIGDISNVLEKFKTVDLGTELVKELKLKKSILTPSGPIYSDLQVILAQ